jgi:hypothetical protein
MFSIRTYEPPPPPSPVTNAKVSHTGRNVVIGVIVIIGVIAAVLIVMNIPGFVPGVGKPGTVTVSGLVITVRTGTVPQKVTFTSMRNAATYVTNVAGGNPGTYSIDLPNGDSYSVSIAWTFLGIPGNADAGTLNLDTFDKTILKNWQG